MTGEVALVEQEGDDSPSPSTDTTAVIFDDVTFAYPTATKKPVLRNFSATF